MVKLIQRHKEFLAYQVDAKVDQCLDVMKNYKGLAFYDLEIFNKCISVRDKTWTFLAEVCYILFYLAFTVHNGNRLFLSGWNTIRCSPKVIVPLSLH